MALLGRNGSGRSTTVKTIMGLVRGEGSIRFRGAEILGDKTFDIAHRGIGYVPENRDIFPKLTVEQNLQLGEKRGKTSPRWSYADMYELFPRLKERQHTEAGVLSGGEPTEGLAPKIVELAADYLKALKDRGVSVLLVEQKLTIALAISERCYVMGHGSIVFEGTPGELRENADVRKEWLEV